MIALSSFRPFVDCSPERQAHYIQAHDSWTRTFDTIYYFNQLEPALAGNGTIFISGSDDRPSISLMAEHAAAQKTWVAIINADIVVKPGLLQLPTQLRRLNGTCAISRRFDLEAPDKPLDWGLDFFLALPEVWRTVAFQIPREFTLGRIRFDTWLCSYFAHLYAKECFDITPSKLILHPQHEERIDQHIDDPEDFYLQTPAYPKKRLTI